MYSNCSYSPETPNLGHIRQFLEPCDLEIWRMTLKNNRATLQCYFQLCASFCSHWWIQTGVTVRKRPQSGSNWAIFRAAWPWNFDGWPWKTIDHLFYGSYSFVHHFVAICVFKLELQSRNAQSGSIRRFLEPCDVEIWRMTLNKSIDEFKLELQSGNAKFGSKSAIFCPVWPWNLTDDIEKQ